MIHDVERIARHKFCVNKQLFCQKNRSNEISNVPFALHRHVHMMNDDCEYETLLGETAIPTHRNITVETILENTYYNVQINVIIMHTQIYSLNLLDAKTKCTHSHEYTICQCA